MGDRANIVIRDDADDRGDREAVFLYGHWSGEGLPSVLMAALHSTAGRNRWKDGPYLARIIFDQMTEGESGGETGFGISTRLLDNDSYALLVVDVERGVVVEYPEDVFRSDGFARLADYPAVAFGDYSGMWAAEVEA